jgi:predicted Zn-dependent protease
MGVLARPLTLIEGGRVAGHLADTAGGRARRPGHLGELTPAASHLVLAPGTSSVRELAADGWILEGGLGATLDPASDRIVVEVACAKELRRGAETGRTFADLELVGELSQLLTAVSRLGTETRTIAIRSDVHGAPSWRSISVPWLATRGTTRARRRIA